MNSSRKTLPSKRKPRRLTSFDELRNDTDHGIDTEQDIVVTPATSTNVQSKSATDDNTFKVPEIPRRKPLRKSKANNFTANKNQTNDSTANSNAIASTSRQRSQDEFDFQIDIEPMNDDELEAYMPQNDTTLANTLESNTKNKDGKSKATSKTKSKRARSDDDTVEPLRISRRRSSCDTHRETFLQRYYNSSVKPMPKKTNTAPIVPVTHRRAENGPPKKKLRTEPEIRRKTTQPAKTNSSRTSIKSTISSKSKTTKPSAATKLTKSLATTPKEDKLGDFTVGLSEKRLITQEFWKDLNDFEKDNEILQEDVTYIKTKDGVIGK